MLLPREFGQIISGALPQLVERLEVVLRVLNTCVWTRVARRSRDVTVAGLFCGFEPFRTTSYAIDATRQTPLQTGPDHLVVVARFPHTTSNQSAARLADPLQEAMAPTTRR